MSSERLYYTDAYLIEFDAVVRDAVKRDDRWNVTLDRTAFYPTSGGQPFDVGTLGEAQVVDVFEQEDGSIGHLVDRELEKNSRVRGQVDWKRRFDHMQQHTGQHLLSAAFDREAAASTVSFHLGTSSSTIDLAKELTAEEIAHVEETANKVLWEDREVCVKFVTAAEAAKLPLRKDPTREGELRIVDITDYDLSACGGTHVRRTGAIGIIQVAGFERFKGGMRVEFVCGHRALVTARGWRNCVAGGVRQLSVVPDELPSAIERLQTDGKKLQKSLESAYERLAEREADALASSGERIGETMVVTAAISGWDASGLKKLASAVTTKPGFVAILISSESPSLIAVSRSQDLSLDAGAILKPLIERYGGKGGGKGSLAQAGGLTGDVREMLDAAKEQVRSAISPPPRR
jgi:alanyl-tRNA synthetase